MNAELILIPIAIHALVTLALYFPMSNARRRSVADKTVRGSVYKLNDGEPPESRQFTNAIRNQNEVGVLFFAACLTAFVSGHANGVVIALAWIFLIAKCVHLWVHVTTNELRHRRPIFMIVFFSLIALWVVILAGLVGIY